MPAPATAAVTGPSMPARPVPLIEQMGEHCFAYDGQPGIPAGMTISQWRAQQAAVRPPAPRRGLLCRLLGL